MIRKSKKQKLPLILFSTYHSSERIEKARKNQRAIDIILNDEAHYLVQNSFHHIIQTVKHNRQYFFTATTRVTSSDTGQGMNNVEQYGELIYLMTPRQAIDNGFMIRPRLHIVTTHDSITKENFDKNLGYVIQESFRQHQFVLNGPQPKMLISTTSANDMNNFSKSDEYKKLINSGVDIYMVTSSKTANFGNMINNQQYSRIEFLEKLKKDGSNPQKRMIVLHYDILTEGIDVSGLTGVLMLRSLKKLKFLQTYGRIARLFLIDKLGIANKTLLPNDLDKFMKPYGWVIVPSIVSEDEDKKEHISEIITELRDYGFNPEEDIKVTEAKPNGVTEKEGPDALIHIEKRSPITFERIQNLQAEYEDEKLASLKTKEDKFKYLGGLISKVGGMFK